MSRIRVLLADDHAILRSGLRLLLEREPDFAVAGEAGDGRAALEWQAREVGNRSGLDVEVCAEDSVGEMPDAQRTCIYRVTQEALQNCVRHAAASNVRVGLTQAEKTVTLRVQDNGKGFHTGRTRGLGLLGMEERVSRLGGRLRLRSELGRGTTLTVELPL